jgi:hypothetical protein
MESSIRNCNQSACYEWLTTTPCLSVMRTKWIHHTRSNVISKNKSSTKHKAGRYEVQSIPTGMWANSYFPGHLWCYSIDDVYAFQPYPTRFSSVDAAISYYDRVTAHEDNGHYNWSTIYSGLIANEPGSTYATSGYSYYSYDSVAHRIVRDPNTLMAHIHGDFIMKWGDLAGQHYPGYDSDTKFFEERTATCEDGSPAVWDPVELGWYCPISTRL